MKIICTLLLAMLTNLLFAQNNLWEDVAKSDIPTMNNPEKELNLRHARSLQLKFTSMRNVLAKAPLENTAAAKRNPLQLELPMPDGSMQTFDVVESPIMEPALAAKYPNIKTYKGNGTLHPEWIARLSFDQERLEAAILTPEGEIRIIPAQGNYLAFFSKDEISDSTAPGSCGTLSPTVEANLENQFQEQESIHFREKKAVITLRQYRLAIATTGEFAKRYNATTKAAVLQLVVNIVNRINAIYEREVAVRFMLVNNIDTAFYLDPATDPYTDGSDVATTYEQSFFILNQTVGINNYDVGHTFIGGCPSTGLQGIGGGRACNNNVDESSFTRPKGYGTSCLNNLTTQVVSTLAHELGHQFRATHTMGQNCFSGYDGFTPFELQCGRTIMSYANPSDDYFHVASLEQIRSFITSSLGRACGVDITSETNNEPTLEIKYQNDFYIPIGTPFELEATGVDIDGDSLTYCWEQFDPDRGGLEPGALFRSFPPIVEPLRVFPRLNSLLNNTSTADERLPDTTRTLTFRCTVRDNHSGAGAVAWKEVKFKATKDAGPFAINYPNDDTVQWTAGNYVEVRWDVANTDKGLVNCKTVNILLSTDGGATFPIVLAQHVPNTGVAKIAIPELTTNRARVRVEAADNIFFDINNRNFQIWPATQAGFTLNAAPRTIPQQCLPDQLQFTVQTDDILGFNAPLTLSLEGSLPGDAVVTFSKNPVLPSESSTLTIQFKTQVEGTFNLQLKATSTNNVSQTIPISFNTVSNDFSQLIPLQPINGASNIGLLTTFVWKKSPYANTYDFELATSPTFGNTVIASVNNLQDTSYVPTQIQFDENRLYFWRIRPVNECGKGAFLEPSVFRTAAIQCAATASTNVPVNISGSGLPTVNSTVTVPTQGTINDINIPLIKASYQPVKSLRISLISPAGTEVILYDQKCGNTLKFETGFDDEAPTEIVCPPDDKLVVRPNQALAAFKGQNTAGTWTLRTKVVTGGFGGGGSIEGWNIEFCSTLSPNNPSLIKNDTLKVPPGKTNTYTRTQLEVTDTDNTPAQLTYLLVTLPQHGTLTRGGAPLQAGSTFTQAEINNFQLQYTHNGDAATFDNFLFVVEDGTGGWLPTQRAKILIDPNATVGVNNLLNDNAVLVFPNPTRDLLNVQFTTLPKGSVVLSLFNAQGQAVQHQHVDNATQSIQLNTNTLASGVYFLAVRTTEGMVTKKVTVQR